MTKIRPTLKKLNELLSDEDLPGFGGVTKSNCETYGKKTFAYFGTRSQVQRRRIEENLEAAGCNVNREYDPKSNRVEVQVSFLRAYGYVGEGVVGA